jgi:hypothetical protein
LPVTINSLVLLGNSNQVNLGSEIVNNTTLNLEKKNLGDRFNKIEAVIPKFLSMLEKYSTVQLYKTLKVQL